MKLLIMQSSSASRHFLSASPKYSPLHSIHKHPQSMFFPLCERLSFTPIQNFIISVTEDLPKLGYKFSTARPERGKQENIAITPRVRKMLYSETS